MADNLDVSSISFGIQDTIATSSQQLIDSFLDEAPIKPDDIKDIKEPPAAAALSKKAPIAKEAVKPAEEEPKGDEPFDPLEDIKDADEEGEDVKPKEGDAEGAEGEFNAFESFPKL